MVISFTHTVDMPWLLPDVAPTGRYVEVPLVAIVHFRDRKLAHENIYWDQASGLKQNWATDGRLSASLRCRNRAQGG
jgi:carboxymethylenebutenolidase